MKINIKATNIELTEDIRNYVDKKLDGLDRYLDDKNNDSIIARVNVGMETLHHQRGNIFKADINLDLPGKTLRAESERDDLYAAIDEARDILERQINKYKKAAISKKHRAAIFFKKLRSFSPTEWLKRKQKE